MPFSPDTHRVRCLPLAGCKSGLLLPPSASFCRNRKLEDRPFLGSRFHPNPASMFFNDLLANRQSDPSARIIRSMQSPENTENLVMICRGYADAIVANRDDTTRFILLCRNLLCTNMDPRGIDASIFDRITDQILEHLCDLRLVAT